MARKKRTVVPSGDDYQVLFYDDHTVNAERQRKVVEQVCQELRISFVRITQQDFDQLRDYSPLVWPSTRIINLTKTSQAAITTTSVGNGTRLKETLKNLIPLVD